MTLTSRVISLLILVIAITLTLQSALWSDHVFSFTLATLFVFALFFNPLEMLVWTGLSAWLLNWQSAPSIEMMLLVGFPVIVSIGKRYIPGRGWAAVAFVVCAGITCFYLAVNAAGVFHHAGFFTADLLVSFFFGMIVFTVLSGTIHDGDTVAFPSRRM